MLGRPATSDWFFCRRRRLSAALLGLPVRGGEGQDGKEGKGKETKEKIVTYNFTYDESHLRSRTSGKKMRPHNKVDRKGYRWGRKASAALCIRRHESARGWIAMAGIQGYAIGIQLAPTMARRKFVSQTAMQGNGEADFDPGQRHHEKRSEPAHGAENLGSRCRTRPAEPVAPGWMTPTRKLTTPDTIARRLLFGRPPGLVHGGAPATRSSAGPFDVTTIPNRAAI